MSPPDAPIKGMLLAAGLGTRMRPLTDHMPKPLIPVAGITLLDRALDWFFTAGVNEVVVNSFYRADMLEAHIQARILSRAHAPNVHAIREHSLLETGGGIKNALDAFGTNPFFCANSDTICLDGPVPALHRLQQTWNDATMDALLLVHPVNKAIGYAGKGDFFVSEGGAVRRRHSEALEKAPFVFTGIQLLHPRFFVNAPEGAFSLNTLYNLGITSDGTLARTRALVHDGHWLHVGDPDGVVQAENFLYNRHNNINS